MYRCYTKICNADQRTKYKTEFNAFYEEYRALHEETVKISEQFRQMEEKLRRESKCRNTSGYEVRIKKLIFIHFLNESY